MAVKLFSYRYGNSLLHRIPAIIKIVLMFALSYLAFSGSNSDSLEVFENPVRLMKPGISFVCAIVLFGLGGFYWKAFKQMKFVAIIGLMVIVLRSVAINEDSVSISYDGLAAGILYTLRFFITSFCAEVIYETTSSLEIKEALEQVQDAVAVLVPPLKKWNPAFVVSMAINFIPLVFETWNKVSIAAKARSGKKLTIVSVVTTSFHQLEALLSCLLFKAEIRRRAIMNRQ